MNLRKDHYHISSILFCEQSLVDNKLLSILDNNAHHFTHFFLIYEKNTKCCITFSDGCLGSRNDEERSEMRYVLRIAESVNHQIFERTLHFQVDWKYSCLSVCSSLSLNVCLSGLWVEIFMCKLHVDLKNVHDFISITNIRITKHS